MSETDETAQEAVETEAQEATPETPAPEVEVTEQDTTRDAISLAEAKKLRQEAAALRKRAKAAEAELEARREAEMSEAEKAQKRAEQAEQAAIEAASKLKQASLKATVAIEASKAKIDPTIALKLVRDDVQFDDDGEPANVTDLIAGLVESHPNLVDNGRSLAGSPANPGRQEPAPESDQDRLKRIYSRHDNAPLERPELFGGGVYMPDGGI